jgi:sigma-B regulation protein RsbU (phosphoserine phosphatase)
MKNFKISLSLRYKLLFILITLPLVSLGLYLLMAKDLFQKDKVAYVFDSTATVSRSLATQARMELGASYATYRAIVENFDFTAGDFTQAGKDLFAKNPRAQAIILFRRNNEGQYVKLGQIGKETEPAKKFLADEAGAGVLRDMAVENTLYLSEVMDAPGMTKIAYRLGEKQEANHMVLLALHSADDMMGAFDPTSGSMYASFMLTKAGKMSVGSMSVVETDLPFLQNILQSKVNEGTAELRLSDGLVYLVSYANVGMGDLMVISRVDKKKALKAVDVLVAKSVLFFIALLASTLLISVFASAQLTSAIRELFDATGKIAAGDFTVRVQPRSKDEVGGLAESFNFMAGEVARLMADTAEKARLEGELNTVKTVQETLFPAAHQQFGALNIKGHFEPASECGGDWWSYSRIDNKIFIYVGDATGHGAPAALITAAARSAAAVIESMPGITPGKAMTILNQAIQMTSKGSIMMTFFVAMIDLDQNKFTYASASHDPPYFIRKSGEKVTKKDLLPLNDVNGPRLGDQKGHVYDEITMDFQPGDQVFFYTDGILDIQDPAGKKWGERTFLKTVIESANSTESVEAKVELIRKTIEDFRTGSNLIDDVTMVMCEYEKRAA